MTSHISRLADNCVGWRRARLPVSHCAPAPLDLPTAAAVAGLSSPLRGAVKFFDKSMTAAVAEPRAPWVSYQRRTLGRSRGLVGGNKHRVEFVQWHHILGSTAGLAPSIKSRHAKTS